MSERHPFVLGTNSRCDTCGRVWGNPLHRKERPMVSRRSGYYTRTDQPMKRVKFIPVKDGDLVEMGATSIPGASNHGMGYPEQFMQRYPHTLIGFKPGTGPRAFGWLVVLVDEDFDSQPIKKRPLQKRTVRAVA